VNRILIIQTAFLGDVILATPLIAELNRLFPNAKIDVLVKRGNESLLDNNPYVHTVYSFDKTRGKLKSLLGLTRSFRKQHYDLVLNLHRFASSGILTMFSGGKMKIGFRKNPFSFAYTKSFPHEIGDGTHEVTRNLQLIADFGAASKKRPELYPSAQDVHKVDQLIDGDYFCFAPASVWFTKQLPKEQWVALIQQKSNFGQIVLIGGKNDFDLCEEIIQYAGLTNAKNLAGKLSLLESAALMQKAKRNYVNDSGPLHIASAMNAPVTAFFCSTVTSFGFGPLSDDSSVIESSVELTCRPCGLHGHFACPEGHFKCGNSIDISGL
jgi:heptosyltransferase-2